MSERKPEIRFVGYEDNWVEKRFVDVFDILSNNTLSRDSQQGYGFRSIHQPHY